MNVYDVIALMQLGINFLYIKVLMKMHGQTMKLLLIFWLTMKNRALNIASGLLVRLHIKQYLLSNNTTKDGYMAKHEHIIWYYCIYWVFFIEFVGYQPQGVELQAFQRIKIFESIAFKEFDYRVLENKTIHSTIRCHNRAGLFSSKSSDGVKISVQHPSIRNAKISVIPLSITEYQAWSHYQSKIQNVRIQWSGFDDYTGINQFKV